MSTLELEHLKHSSAGSNAITLASDGSLTLAGNTAAAGDLTVDTNVFHVDAADNRVGIGTTTPSVDLDIVGVSSRIKQQNSSGHQINYGLWDGANYRIEGDANRPIMITSYNTASPGGGIKMGISGGNHLNILNGGYVTKPSNTCFIATRGSNQTINNQQWTKVNLDTEILDVANNFDHTGNNRFNAPVAGNYFFTGTVNWNGSTHNGGYLYMAFYKNGGIFTYMNGLRPDPSTYFQSDTQLNGGAIIPLSAGDFVELYAYAHWSGTGSLTGSSRTRMSGFLIG